MKRILSVIGMIMVLSACGGSGDVEPDYTTDEFEKALNDGEEVQGKIVSVKIEEIAPDSALGFNLQAGEHLNFVSDDNPELKAGDEFIAEVEEVENMLGSYIITYKKK